MMSDTSAVKLFLKKASAHADINALGPRWEQRFADAMQGLRDDSMRTLFKTGFAQAIAGGISPREYERATGWDFDTEEEFRDHLRELWSVFYPDEDPADFC